MGIEKKERAKVESDHETRNRDWNVRHLETRRRETVPGAGPPREG